MVLIIIIILMANKEDKIEVPISNYLKMKWQKHCQQRKESMAGHIRYLIKREIERE